MHRFRYARVNGRPHDDELIIGQIRQQLVKAAGDHSQGGTQEFIYGRADRNQHIGHAGAVRGLRREGEQALRQRLLQQRLGAELHEGHPPCADGFDRLRIHVIDQDPHSAFDRENNREGKADVSGPADYTEVGCCPYGFIHRKSLLVNQLYSRDLRLS